MSTKKGYKSVPWLFGKAIEIPEEWEVKRLGQLTKFSSGEFLPQSKQVNGKIPVYGGNGITGWHNQPLINNSTVVFGRVGVYCGIVYLSENKSWITDNAIFVKELSNDLDLKYFFLYLSRLNINLLAEVSAQPKITQGILNHIGIKFPIDKKEQQKIASILSNVDNLIDSTNKIIENSKSLKTGLMQKLLTRGIGHTKFKKVPWLFGKEIEIPEEWEVKKLNEITNKIGDGIHSTPEYVEHSEYYFINGNNLINGKITYFENTKNVSKEEFLKYELKLNENTILLSINGTIGNVAFYNKEKIILGKSASYIICNDKLNTLFLFYQLQSNLTKKYFSTQLTGTTISNLSLSSIRNMIFHLPLFPEQQKIATILSNIDAQIDSQTQYKDKLERLKKSLMQKLLTGEVRV